MARFDPRNPFMWVLVQVFEYIAVGAVLSRVIPDSTPRWLQVAILVVVLAGVFVLNLYVVMPKIGRSSRAEAEPEEPRPPA